MIDRSRKKISYKAFVGILLVGLVFFGLGPFTVFVQAAEDGYSINQNVKGFFAAKILSDPTHGGSPGGDPAGSDPVGEPVPDVLVKAKDSLNKFFEQFKYIKLIGSQGEWALVNLILAVIGLIMAIVAACSFGKKHRRIGFLIITIPIGIAGAIVFYLTENMRNLVVFVDSWTILSAVILVVEIIMFNLARK